ncbi:hypothetical protein C1H46_042082 [Malus baccata]|uniref:FCP1 homology domain-containing protein n=1 Tax=Malus baccata TaxID=106549 RepID=A0A540KDU3_MALBA|nr:hypothetical protein C1H46_042082 [Malus baccata]
MLDSRRRFPSDYLLINMETAVCNEKPNSKSEKEYSEKLNESMNNALLEEPSVNISANLPLTEALPVVLPKIQRKRARSSGAKVINKFDPVQSLDIPVNPVESHVQRSHAPNLDDSDLCCLKGTLSVENITPEKKNCVQYLGRDEHHNASLGTDTLMDEPSMSIISNLVPAELPPQGGLTNRKRKKKDTIGVALESKNSCPESCAVICTAISEKEEQQEDLFHERKKKRKKQDKRHKICESDDKNCDIPVGTSLAETIMPTVDHSVEPSVVDFPEQVERVAMAQPPMEGVGTNENSKIAKPIKDLSSSRKKKKRTRKKSKTQESNDESCRNDRSCELSVGISLVESIMPGRDLPQQPPVSESSKQKLEGFIKGNKTKHISPKFFSAHELQKAKVFEVEDLSSSRKKKKKNQKKNSETRESNNKSCELSVGISLVESIMPGVDPSQQPPVSKSSEQKLELLQPLMEGINAKINSESSDPVEDLSSSRKKKKKNQKKNSETRESNNKSCELSVGISLVESIMPGVDPSQQPPVSKSSEQKLELLQPLMEGINAKINSESSDPVEDLSSSRKKKKKNQKKNSETRESNNKSCELSVGISLVESIMPGVDPSQQPPVSKSSEQKLELLQPLMEGINAKINSESSDPVEDLSSSRKKKKKNQKKNSETRESNDKSCELSVGISLVESIMPGVDPSQQPPVSKSSEQKLELLQPLMEGINAKINSESSDPVEDLSSSRKKKKKTQKKKSDTRESNDESCGNDKRGEFSVGSSLVENIVPGVDLSQKPPVSESSEQKLELPQSLMDGISTKINSVSSEPIGDLSSSRTKKKKFKTRESNDKSCELSVGIPFVENFMPGIDPSQQPPDSEFSEEKVDLPQPLVGGNSAAASSEGPKSRTVDLSCSQEQKKKKRKRRHKTKECIDERYDLSVGTSLGGNTFPGVDLTVQPPVTMFSKQDLEVEKPLVEGIRQRINSESIKLIEVLSCSQRRKERKKRLKMRKSNDTSSDPSVGTLVEKIIPGVDPSPQPPVAVVSDLGVIQLLLEETTLQEKNEDNDQNKRSNASGNNNTNHQVCAGFPGQVDLGAVAKEGSRSQIPNWAVERPLVSVSKKKLLILDVNGLLANIVQLVPQQIKLYKPDTMISRKSVFKRPFYDSFLLFCFDYFNVAIWSSRNKKNVDEVVDYLLGISKKKLLFCWNQSHCTKTKFKTLDNEKKPLVLKELRKLWEKHDPDLPLARGEYNETNTLLVDDSPYKALCNPENTAIFPFPYHFKNRMDRSLGVGGNIRRYLEGLVYAPNVQEYVKHHPFGQGPITEKAKSWEFYSQVLEDQARSPKT